MLVYNLTHGHARTNTASHLKITAIGMDQIANSCLTLGFKG